MIARPRWSLLFALCVAAAAVAALPACTSREQPQSTPQRFAASRTIGGHGLHIAVFVSSQDIAIADRLEVLIEARRESADAAPISWPAVLADLRPGSGFPPNPADPGKADWNVVDVVRRTFAPGHETIEFVLEPYLDGDKPIPAFAFQVGSARLSTEPIAVRVTAQHASDAATVAGEDPAKLLAALGSPLPPVAPSRPWLANPVTLGIVAAAGVLVLGGGVAVVVHRRTRRRSTTPDEYLDRVLALGTAAMSAPGDDHSAEIAEKTIGALRIWLAATRRIAPGTSGRELVAWIRASPAPSAPDLAEQLQRFETIRFAPGVSASSSEVTELLRSVSRFTRELRTPTASLRSEGGVAA
jgi:hypothetical protein